jgi:hypothetical protein
MAADWQVLSSLEKVAQSAIAPAGIWGWPYLFCKGKPNSTNEARIMVGTAIDNKMISQSKWKWNMRWKLMMDGPEVLTDVAPAVGMAWGVPVVFVRRKTDGAIFYSNYKMTQATPWQQLSGTTDRALAATGFLFGSKLHLYVFRKNITDNKIYYTHTSDSGDIKNWSTWTPIPGNFETERAPAATWIKTAAGSRLFVFAKRKGSNRISYTSSSDGNSWSSWKDIVVNQKFIESVQHHAPSATAYNDKIYVAFLPLGSPFPFPIMAAVYSPATDQWSAKTLCSEAAASTGQGIGIRGYGDDLFVFLCAEGSYSVVVQHANA